MAEGMAAGIFVDSASELSPSLRQSLYRACFLLSLYVLSALHSDFWESLRGGPFRLFHSEPLFLPLQNQYQEY